MDTLQVVWARYFVAFVLALLFSNPVNAARADADRAGRCCSSAARRCCWSRPCSTSSRCAICSSTRRWRSCSRRRSWSRCCAGRCSANGSAGGAGPRSCVGFCGVLLVARPGFGGMHPAALLSLGSAICYAFYIDLDAHAVAHRLQRDHAVLFQSGRRGGRWLPVAAVRLDARRRPGSIVALMVLIGALRRRRALPADPGPPAGAGLGAGAVHLYPDRLDDDARLSGVRRRAHRWTIVGRR